MGQWRGFKWLEGYAISRKTTNRRNIFRIFASAGRLLSCASDCDDDAASDENRNDDCDEGMPNKWTHEND